MIPIFKFISIFPPLSKTTTAHAIINHEFMHYLNMVSKVNKFQQQMFNIYKNEKRNTDKSQLRILDYRNGKYQGTTVGQQITREGVGMVLDHNYLLAIAAWRQGCVEGQVLIIFPDCTMFYGFLKNRLPVGIGCYQVTGKLQIYSMIGNGGQDLFVLDDNANKTLILLAISKQIMEKLYEQPTVYQHILKQQSVNTKQMGKIRKEAVYGNAEEKWEIIEGFFKTVFLSELKSYKQFVKHYFQTQLANSPAKIQVIQTKQEVQFNYQNSSIFCKISQNFQNQTDFRIKLLGYYNHSDHQFEVSKKMAYKNDVVEETIQNFRKEYPLNSRPPICLKHTQSYFRKSLYFVNDFLQIDYLYRIKFIYNSIEVSIGQLAINRNAQKLLQNPTIAQTKQKEDRDREMKPRQSQISEQIYSKEHLDKVKDEIYKAVKNKSIGRNKSTNNSRIQYSQPQKVTISRVTNNNRPAYKPKQAIQPHSRQHTNHLTPSPGKRSYVYLEQPNERIKPFKSSPKKYQYTKELYGRGGQQKNYGKLTKYKYLEKDQPKNEIKNQNLTALTSYYEDIQNQLRKQTPRKSQRKYRNIDGGIIPASRYSIYEGKFDKDMQKGEQKYEKSPLGTKKVFKYGWE